jgi:hypothetical protein
VSNATKDLANNSEIISVVLPRLSSHQAHYHQIPHNSFIVCLTNKEPAISIESATVDVAKKKIIFFDFTRISQ